MLKIYFDGATEPRNPGGAMGYGIVVKKNNQTIHTTSWFVEPDPTNTNNIAEYLAFIEALNYLYEVDLPAKIYGDSMMVVRQMKREWKIKKGAYTPYAYDALELVKKMGYLIEEIKWIPREQNSEADEASKSKLAEQGIYPRS